MSPPTRWSLFWLLLCSLSGCAQFVGTASAAPPEENTSMTHMTEQQVHTLAEYPELTPEGMGRRFLKYLDALTSREQLTPEFLEQQMGVKLVPELGGAYFTMRLPDSERQYAVSYYQDGATPPHRSVKLWFSTAANNDQEIDMSPVCGMDFDAYRVGLERIGYKDAGLEDYDHFRRLPVYYFIRGDAMVVIDALGESESNPEHLCVGGISVSLGR